MKKWETNEMKHPFFTVPFPPFSRRSKIFLTVPFVQISSAHSLKETWEFLPLIDTHEDDGYYVCLPTRIFFSTLPGPFFNCDNGSLPPMG